MTESEASNNYMKRFHDGFEKQAGTRITEGFIRSAERDDDGGYCLCGKKIMFCYSARNSKGVTIYPIGSCCIKKFKISAAHCRSYISYILYAETMVETPKDREFIERVKVKVKKYGNRIILEDYQWDWLEKIAKVPIPKHWHKKTWDEVDWQKSEPMAINTFMLRCPDCGCEFEKFINDMGLEDFETKCPECGEPVDDGCVVKETGSTKPMKLMTNY